MDSQFKYFSIDSYDESLDKSYNNKLVLNDYSSDEDLETISLSSQHDDDIDSFYSDEDLETISLSYQYDDIDSFYSDETPNVLVVIMNSPDEITEQNQEIMEELDILIASI